MSKIIGIDLGTTNSCVALYEGGEPVVIPNAEGSTHHAVAWSRSPRPASAWSVRSPNGRPSPTPTARSFPSSAIWAPTKRSTIDGKNYTPQEISAMILQKLKADAEDYLGDNGDAGGHHRARLLLGRAAAGDQGRRQDRGA